MSDWIEHHGAEPTTMNEACQAVSPSWFLSAHRRFEVTTKFGVVIVDTTHPERAVSMVVEVLGEQAATGSLRDLTAVN